jgi:integrase
MRKTPVKISELFDLVRSDYRRKGKRSLDTVEIHIKRLTPYFGDRVANLMRSPTVDEYIDHRQAEGASNATINREMAVLKRGYNLGLQKEIIDRKPYIEKLPESGPREEFFEYDEFRKLEAAARAKGKRQNFDGDVTGDIIVVAYFSGWRLNEVLNLNREWIKTDLRIAILPAAHHKNKKPKILPLEGEVWEIIERRLAGANEEGFLFHRSGKKVKSVRKLFDTLCSEIGLEKHVFHSLRHSLVTNINRAGIDRETGKKISGHDSDSAYQGYNHTTVEQLRDAVKKVNKHLGIKEKVTQSPKFLEKVLTPVIENEITLAVKEETTLTKRQVTAVSYKSPELGTKFGGEGGIRTPETRKSLPDFESNSQIQPTVKSSLFASLKRFVSSFINPKVEE